MSQPRVPTIFNERRRINRAKRRMARRTSNMASFILDDIAEDMIERLKFIRHEAADPFVIGPCQQELSVFLNDGNTCQTSAIDHNPADPMPGSGHDLILSIGQLDAVNDLPGALIHFHRALRPGGLVIASFVGGASLPRLRAAMLAADGDRPAARIHPMVDARAAPQLLQRAGWKDPVVDTHTLTVRYSALDQLVSDLRDQALGSALADPGPPLGKAALAKARAAFLEQADDDGKVSETFEIITLTGRRSLAGT